MKREEKNLLELNELISLAVQGNQEAFELILNDYIESISKWTKIAIRKYGYVCRLDDEPEELFQIAQTVFASCLNGYKPSYNFDAYSYKCVINGLNNEFRKNRSNKGMVNHNAFCLDKTIKDEEMPFIDLIQNNHPEFEGTYCYDYNNPKVIREILAEEFDEDKLKIYDLKCQGYNYNEIGQKLEIKEKSAAYYMKNMEKFCAETLTKKK